MYKHLYSRFLSAAPERLHFAAHSHHLWPDVSRDAHIQYWDDAARLADYKWDHIFGEIIAGAQTKIARTLHLSSPTQIAFAPNTHEFVVRLLSCFEPGKSLSILTTDSEFHSFRRQMDRMKEFSFVTVNEIPVEPFSTFESRFAAEAQKKRYDLVFSSQVFFTLGHAIQNVNAFVDSLGNSHTIIVLDGYHAFCALPTDLSKVEDRIFYIAGGYKYAQSGEGACFMHVPKNCTLRPFDTGWFAVYGALEKAREKSASIPYSTDGFRFWGATFDPSGLYRLNAVLRMFADNGLTVPVIHKYVQDIQAYFLDKLAASSSSSRLLKSLVREFQEHGHFFTFRIANAAEAYKKLTEQKVVVDYRGDFLRFGFGIYHTKSDIDELISRMDLIEF